MRKLITSIAAALMLASSVLAEDNPVVVELFTSQGCSSCPPADALLHDLAKRDDVLALALHVDYWDYIGWKDIFANPEYTKRQRAYARVAGKRTIYTPQMVINGKDHVVGNRPRDVKDLIKRHKAADDYVNLKLARKGDTLQIQAKAMEVGGKPMEIKVVRYRPQNQVNIKRGENAGRKLNYANVVTDLTTIGSWDGQKPLSMSTKVRGDQPIVVLIQRAGHGAVEAAARVK